MTYIILEKNNRDWDEDLKAFKYVMRDGGCGCCSCWEGATKEKVENHISELEEEIEYTKSILQEL